MNKEKYDEEKMTKAQKSLILRIVVAAYLIYLGIKIFKAEDTTMNYMLSHIIGIFFIASALAFGAFSLLRMRSDVLSARITDSNSTDRE